MHYRATGDAVTALIAGDVKAAFVSTALALAQVNGGRMVALATTAALQAETQRWAGIVQASGFKAD